MIYLILQYAIEGPLRSTLLVLEWFIALLFFEIGFGFIIRIQTSQKKFLGDIIEKGFMCLVFGFSAMWMLKIASNYYVCDSYLQIVLTNLSYLIIILGTLFFLYYNEKFTLLFYKKNLLTKLYSIVVVGYLFFFFFLTNYTTYYMFLNFPFFFICFISYSKKIRAVFVKKKFLLRYRISLALFFVGIVSLILGYGMTAEFTRNLFQFGLEIRLIGDIIQIIAAVLLILFLCLVPSLAEYEWKRMIDAIIIMQKGGLLIYDKYLNKEVDELSGSLISGSLTILKKMLEKTTAGGGTSIIEQQGKTLIFQPGDYIYAVLICDEPLESLQQLLKTLVERIEKIYHGILEHWKGDLKIFDPVKNIVKSLFDF